MLLSGEKWREEMFWPLVVVWVFGHQYWHVGGAFSSAIRKPARKRDRQPVNGCVYSILPSCGWKKISSAMLPSAWPHQKRKKERKRKSRKWINKIPDLKAVFERSWNTARPIEKSGSKPNLCSLIAPLLPDLVVRLYCLVFIAFFSFSSVASSNRFRSTCRLPSFHPTIRVTKTPKMPVWLACQKH